MHTAEPASLNWSKLMMLWNRLKIWVILMESVEVVRVPGGNTEKKEMGKSANVVKIAQQSSTDKLTF